VLTPSFLFIWGLACLYIADTTAHPPEDPTELMAAHITHNKYQNEAW
jgi:hypothetical protein